MGCDEVMVTLEESSPHMHLKKREKKKACSHFQEATVTGSFLS